MILFVLSYFGENVQIKLEVKEPFHDADKLQKAAEDLEAEAERLRQEANLDWEAHAEANEWARDEHEVANGTIVNLLCIGLHILLIIRKNFLLLHACPMKTVVCSNKSVLLKAHPHTKNTFVTPGGR